MLRGACAPGNSAQAPACICVPGLGTVSGPPGPILLCLEAGLPQKPRNTLSVACCSRSHCLCFGGDCPVTERDEDWFPPSRLCWASGGLYLLSQGLSASLLVMRPEVVSWAGLEFGSEGHSRGEVAAPRAWATAMVGRVFLTTALSQARLTRSPVLGPERACFSVFVSFYCG